MYSPGVSVNLEIAHIGEYAFDLQNSIHWLEKQRSLEQRDLRGVSG